MDSFSESSRRDWITWVAVAVALVGLGVVAFVFATARDAVIHGHPAYLVVLIAATALCLFAGLRSLLVKRRRPGTARRVGRIVLIVLATGGIAVVAWLRPYPAVEPALAQMATDDAVTVTETATEIVLTPTKQGDSIGVFFQPGALVDARAYVPTLRPLAVEGFTVVIPKQPLGIAFLALGTFDAAATRHTEISNWVVGGHSLGGTVAAIEASDPGSAGVVGLMLYASYPAGDISDGAFAVLSLSGSQDGLATPEKIEASRANLPPSSEFVVIEGASHAQFGSYGRQFGDGVPTISDADARQQISDRTVAFVESLQ